MISVLRLLKKYSLEIINIFHLSLGDIIDALPVMGNRSRRFEIIL